jgi:DNA-binding response OmpR family regulator
MDTRRRILIAEADRDSRSAVMWCLLAEGFWVEPVANAFDAALALDRADLPDLAIIDLGLPGLPARKLIEKLRTSPRLQQIPIIATSFTEPIVKLPPGVAFLKKPCNPEVLLARVRALLGPESKSALRTERPAGFRGFRGPR